MTPDWPRPSSGSTTRACSTPATSAIGPVSAHGFFGGDHERNDQEWDSNGEALWAFGRFDRIQGPAAAFGAKIYAPYVR